MRYDIRFSGSVQGVGFRAAARSLALLPGSGAVAPAPRVTGWVRNEPDGDVSMTVEGDRAAIEAYLADLRAALGPRIERETITTHAEHHGYASFDIRR